MTRPTHRRTALLLLGLLTTLAALAGAATPASATPRQEAGDPEGFATLTLENDWAPAGAGTATPRVRLVHGIVELSGAMVDGTAPTAFTLPSDLRPAKKVILAVGLCSGQNGRLVIKPDGRAQVSAELPGSDPGCFTSLEGVSFALAPAGQVPLTLQHGWTGGPFQTRSPAAAVVGGVVHLSGVIATNGTDRHPFVLPPAMRPAATVFVPVDLCQAHDGRLRIGASGTVTVQAEDSFAGAQCSTSLDGVTWVVRPAGHTTLVLENGALARPRHTRTPRAGLMGGIVRLSGALQAGSSTAIFTLPPALWPSSVSYVQVDLCHGANGRLVIDLDGVVTVESEGDLTAAQCFTSLEGASFVR